jgi:hypothetical protein
VPGALWLEPSGQDREMGQAAQEVA